MLDLVADRMEGGREQCLARLDAGMMGLEERSALTDRGCPFSACI
jgi:hypothetical protein